MKFTDAKIKALKPKPKRYEVWEAGRKGFGVRVSPHGRKSWVYMYWVQGLQKRMTFGTYPSMTLEEAHTAFAKTREMLARGIDPGLESSKSKKIEQDASSIRGLVDEYIERHAKKKKKTWREDERVLNKEIIPRWGKRKAKSITRRDVILLLDEIVERGAGAMANRTLDVVRKMFAFGVGRDIIPASPCIALEAPAKKVQRDRVLNEKEIRSFWFDLENASVSQGTRLALKLELVTCQRKGEVALAEWSEMDLQNNWWTIPAEKSKNGLPHRVFLTEMAKDILIQVKELAGESRWIFPSPRGDNHITSRSLSRAISKSLSGDDPIFKMARFTPHDLRRTGASQMASMGIPRLTIGKILNHAEPGVTAVYDRHTYDAEKRQALETWARKLESILTGKTAKIVNLQRK